MPTIEPAPAGYKVLHQAIDEYFSLEELQELCVSLGIEYQNLPGEIRRAKARELVALVERSGRTGELLEQLQGMRPNVDWLGYQPAEREAEPPFKGLRYYDEKDAGLFFGREAVTAELVEHLRQHRFLAVVGASGSGKSSVVRAGVVAAVRQGAIEVNGQNSGEWPIHVITPGDEPLKALAGTLTRDSESVTAMKTLLGDLQAGGDSLELWLYRQLGERPGGRMLLVVDQFEELFTLCRDGEARRLFVENLVGAAEKGRLWLILTLRADFYAFAVQMEALRPLLETRQKIVGAMTGEELCEAIQRPAEVGGWQFQPGLVETMLAEVGAEAGSLPLLSHALLETWRRRQGRVMTLAGYQEAGGVRRAITRTADAVYEQLDGEQQGIARRIFLRLTELGEGTEDTRRRVRLEELVPEGDAAEGVRGVLTRLADARLVTTEEESAEVTHEALIREWPLLRQWLNEDREWLRLHRELARDAREWEAAGRHRDLLYRGVQLAQTRESVQQREGDLGKVEWDFVLASSAERDRVAAEREAQRQRELDGARQLAEAQQRRVTAVRRALAGVAALSVLALVAAGLAINASRLANSRAQIAQSQALAAAAEAIGEKNHMRALLLATEAGRTYPTALASSTINQQLPFLAQPLITLNQGLNTWGADWNRDENRILSWGYGGKAQVWNAQTGEELLTLNHDGIEGGQWNTDGSLILTWGVDKTARVWDVGSGEAVITLAYEDWVNGGEWNADGSSVLTWSVDRTAKVWNVQNGVVTELKEVNGGRWNRDGSRILTWGSDGVARVVDSQNGNLLLELPHDYEVWGGVWNGDESNILTWGSDRMARVWDAQNGEALLTLAHDNGVSGAQWNKDGNRILTCDYNGVAWVWDVQTGESLVTLRHEGDIGAGWEAQWSGDESQIVTWSLYGAAQLWDAQSGESQWTLMNEGVNGVEWNGNENRILTWSNDVTAKIWDSQNGEVLLVLTHEGEVNAGQWNQDGSRILTWSSDGTARVWDVESREAVLTLNHESRVNGGQWDGNENRILTWSRDGTTKVWDAESGEALLTLADEFEVTGAQWSSDENRILTWGFGISRMWHVPGGERLFALAGLESVQWSRNENRILGWTYDGNVQVWDVQNGELLLTLPQGGWVSGGEWNRSGSRILTWGNTGAAKVWDSESGMLLMEFVHEGWVEGAQWSADESHILTWTTSWLVQVWDVQSGGKVMTLTHESQINGAQWSVDGSLILTWSQDQVARVWDSESGEVVLTLTHEGNINGGRWNSDESRILTWSSDGTAKIWNAQNGEGLMTLTGDGSVVSTARWNKDESQILLTTEGGLVRVYHTALADLLEVACRFATRNLTWAEWQQYLPDQEYRQTCPNLPVHPSVPQS